jgi:hypothetical protein
MTQKSAKKKSKKNSKAGAETSVLGNLRTTRPTRLGGDRRGAPTGSLAATATKAPKRKSSVKATKPAVPATGTRKAAKRSPTAAAQSKATAAHRPAVPPPPPPAADGRPKGTEMVTTAVQAAGELAQIGATVGSQLLKRAARRIPRP